MLLFRKLSLYLAIAGVIAATVLVRRLRAEPPVGKPLAQPTRSPFRETLAATGIIEATRENVRLGAPKSGLVQKVFVAIGDRVKTGDLLLQLDNREAEARLTTSLSQLAALKASLAYDDVQLADARDQFARVQKLERSRIATEDDLKRREFAVQAMAARVTKTRADIASAQSQVEQSQVELAVLSVRAPRDGTVLQLNTRAGEFANALATEALLILGDVDHFQVRADVDEQNAPLVEPHQPAVAFLKGDTKRKMPLRFVRIDPFVIPKRSLTGDSSERVDTRVLQIIFALDRPEFPIYVGQQVDVFIQRGSRGTEPAPTPQPVPAVPAER